MTRPNRAADAAAGDDVRPDDIQPPEDIQAEADAPEGDGLVEVEYGGKVYAVPPELKGALMRQADYTRKTQALAQHRQTLEAAGQAVAAAGGRAPGRSARAWQGGAAGREHRAHVAAGLGRAAAAGPRPRPGADASAFPDEAGPRDRRGTASAQGGRRGLRPAAPARQAGRTCPTRSPHETSTAGRRNWRASWRNTPWTRGFRRTSSRLSPIPDW